MILPCSCKSDFQDSRHGKGNRVHNITGNNAKARCTVCGSEKALTAEQIKKAKKEE